MEFLVRSEALPATRIIGVETGGLPRQFRLPNGFEHSTLTMADCNYLGTGLFVGEHARDFARILQRILSGAGIDTPAPEVAVTRVVSATGPDFHRCRQMFCEQAGSSVAY